jgi:oligosaccharide repeat unit polymerase
MIRFSQDSMMKSTILIILSVIAIILVYSSDTITANSLIVLTILNIIQTAIIILYCLRGGKIKKRFTLFAFNVAYFILLQGSYAMNIGNTQYYGTHVFASVSSISYFNEAKGLMYILIAQMITFIAYSSKECQSKSIARIDQRYNESSGFIKWSKAFLVVGGIAAFTKLILKIVYVAAYGYLGTYLSGGSALYENVLLDLFDKFYYLGLYGYLAAFPNLKDAKKHIYIFLVYSFLTLLTGIRGELVINILFIVWYLSKRDEMKTEERVVLNKGRMFTLLVLGVISFSFLYEFGFSRFGQHSANSGFLNKILGFIDSQGGSGRLTALGLEHKDNMLPFISPFLMVFYPIRNFLLNNSIVRIFTGGVGGQGLNSLKVAPSFGSVLTYVTNPGSYLNGASMGTSYVAEVSVAFGLIGIIIASILLGKAFAKIDNIQLDRWSSNVLWMNAFVTLTYIPRHGTLQIIPESVAALLFVVLVKALAGAWKGRSQ